MLIEVNSNLVVSGWRREKKNLFRVEVQKGTVKGKGTMERKKKKQLKAKKQLNERNNEMETDNKGITGRQKSEFGFHL